MRQLIIYFLFFCCFVCLILFTGDLFAQNQLNTVQKYIDVHNHIQIRSNDLSQNNAAYENTIQETVKAMDQYGIDKMILMNPPFSKKGKNSYEMATIIPYLKKYPGRFYYLSGGGSLSPMIHEAVQRGETTKQMKAAFKKKAYEILDQGALGFGELAIEHFSLLGPSHHYQAIPADHPLYLLLVDIAAEKNVPIDLHMEAIPTQMPLPSRYQSPPNPTTLTPNMEAFERLLSHNPKTKIIWSHVGWCCTGQRTIALMKKLFDKHSNLYMSFKIAGLGPSAETHPLQDRQTIKSEWLEFIKAYSDRFLIGSDNFYSVSQGDQNISYQGKKHRKGRQQRGTGHHRMHQDNLQKKDSQQKKAGSARLTNIFFRLLPAGLANKIGIENPKKVFGI